MPRKTRSAPTVITTHMNADLDGFSSMIAAALLHPEGLLVMPDTSEPAVRMVLKHPLLGIESVYSWSDINLDSVRTVVLVDTADPERIGNVGLRLLERDVEWIAYDTHPPETIPEEIRNRIEYHHAPYGATASLMVEELQRHGVTLTRTQATLLALGVYEDTGMFTFVGTTPADFRAAAYLLENGADVRLIRDMLQIHLNEEQMACLNDLRASIEPLPIAGPSIYFAGIRRSDYVPDLALVVHRLMDELPVEVLFVALEIPGHVYLIGRSRSGSIDVGAVLGELGGGGHAFAASVSLKGKTLIEVKENLTRILERTIPSVPRARDIMTRPVRTVSSQADVKLAADMLNQLRVNALPVTAEGKIVGMITRQIIDQALRMGLKERRVEEMIEPAPPIVPLNATLDEITRAMVEHRTRIVLVGKDEAHVEGVITRMDLIRSRYDLSTNGAVQLARPVPRPPNYWRRIERLCSERTRTYLTAIGEIAASHHMTAYLVGGSVRDIVMERAPQDIDIVIEGSAIPIARLFARRFGARIHPYHRYGTAVVIFPDDFRVDFATARTETYEFPGAPPRVEVGTMLRQDLYRRDFTINAMAIALNPDRRGQLVDFYGGLRDVHDGVVRILHALSFFEDPARILRALRFAGRYSFRLSPETDHLLRQALQAGVMEHLPGARLGLEMRYLLQEHAMLEIVQLMIHYDLFVTLHPRWRWRRQDLPDFRPFIETLDWYRITRGPDPEMEWCYRALVLFRNLPRATRVELARRMNWPLDVIQQIMGYREAIRNLSAWFRRHHETVTPGDVLLRIRTWPRAWIVFGMAYYHEPLKHLFKRYLVEWATTRPLLTGHDLKTMGLKPGPLYRRILDALWKAQVNGRVTTREEALEWVRENYLSPSTPTG